MAGSRLATFLIALAVGPLALGACSSSKNTSSTTTTKAAAGRVTAPSSPSGSTVNVVLGDAKGVNGQMTLVPTPASIPAGDITFVVKNAGTIDHEMIVLRTPTAFDRLPIVDAGDPPAPVATGADKVDETANVGETGDPNIKPGESRTFTVKSVTAGPYVLLCNIAKHYGLGMRAAFVVS